MDGALDESSSLTMWLRIRDRNCSMLTPSIVAASCSEYSTLGFVMLFCI